MSLFDVELRDCRRWSQVGDTYEVTRKPRGFDTSSLAAIPFASMADIPQGGAYAPDFTLKAQSEIKSGTYFERGDILVAKITPSFENGKQALTTELPTPFGFATTEVIPLRPRTEGHDRRLLFFYLLHPDVRHHIAERMEGTTGRQRVPEEVLLDLPFPEFEPEEQTAVSDSLETIQRLIRAETKSVQTAIALKRGTIRSLFTHGLRGEAKKETEIGPVPESWEIKTILELCEIWSGGTPRKSIQEYWGGKIPWVSGKDLKSPVLDDAMDHVTVEGAEAGSRLALVWHRAAACPRHGSRQGFAGCRNQSTDGLQSGHKGAGLPWQLSGDISAIRNLCRQGASFEPDRPVRARNDDAEPQRC